MKILYNRKSIVDCVLYYIYICKVRVICYYSVLYELECYGNTNGGRIKFFREYFYFKFFSL